MNLIKEAFNDEVLKHIAKKYKLSMDTLKKIGGFENIIYTYDGGKKALVLRITHASHRKKNLLKGEIEWLNYLSDHGVSVAQPHLIHKDYEVRFIIIMHGFI